MASKQRTRVVLGVAAVVGLIAAGLGAVTPLGDPPEVRIGVVPEGYAMADLAEPGSTIELGTSGPARIGGTASVGGSPLVDVIVSGGGQVAHATMDRSVTPPVWWVLAAPPEGGEATFDVTAIGADGSRSSQSVTYDFVLPEPDEIIISPEVVVLGSEGAPTLTGWDPGNGVVVVSGATPGQVRQDTILVSGIEDGVADSGLLRRVIGYEGDAEQLRAQTIAIPLDQAVLQARIPDPPPGGGNSAFRRLAPATDVELGFGVGIPEGVSVEDALDRMGSCSECEVKDPIKVGSGRAGQSGGWSVELAASAKMGVGLDLDIRWEWDWFRSGFRGQFGVGVTMDGAVAMRLAAGQVLPRAQIDADEALASARDPQLMSFEGSRQVLQRSFGAVTIPIMGVPLVLVPKVRIDSSWEGELAANTSFAAAAGFSMSGGMEWDDGDLEVSGDASGDGDLRFNLGLVGSAEMEVEVSTAVLAYDSFGPDIATDIGLLGDFELFEESELGPGIKGSASVPFAVEAGLRGEVPMVGRRLLDADVVLFERQLFSLDVVKHFNQPDTGLEPGIPSPDGAPPPLDPVTGSDLAMVVLVDTSGSMTETDDGGTVKLEGAKVAMRDFVRTMPSGSRVGLRTYPSPGADCDAGVRRLPVAPVDANTLQSELDALVADGSTPTAAALQATFEDLPRTGKRTVVLVSDGKSNCDGDPCQIARELNAQGIDVDLTVNALGFQIDDAGAEELACIAEATGGVYATVEDSDALKRELTELAGPVLTVQLEVPTSSTLDLDGRPTEPVVITAKVKNAGGRVAPDVLVRLSAIDDLAVITDAGRPIGAIQPGEQRIVNWTVLPRATGSNHDVSFEVTAEQLDDPSANTAMDTGTVGVVSESGDRVDSVGPVLRNASRVAILGDSFSAGEGTRQYQAETDTKENDSAPRNGCHRSDLTYGGRTTAGPVAFEERIVLACSGAITAHVTGSDQRNTGLDGDQVLDPQVEQLRRSGGRLDAVLLTMGGNDVQFREIATVCILGRNCSFPATICVRVGGGRKECVEQGGAANLFEDGLVGLSDRLGEAYAAIDAELNSPKRREQRAGRAAPIVVLAYPKLLPTSVERQSNCVIGLSPEEVRTANRVVERLNSAVRDAVDEARVKGLPVYFAPSVERAFQADAATGGTSHTLCDPDPYANGLALDGAKPEVESLHPNVRGYEAMTDLMLVDARQWEPVPDRRRSIAVSAPVSRSVADMDLLGDRVAAGSAAAVRGDGFGAGTDVVAQLASTPVAIGVATANGDGAVRVPAEIPRWSSEGEHHIRLIGVDADGNRRILETPVTVTSARWSRWWAVSAVWLVAALGAVVLLRRRRRAPGQAASLEAA